MISLVATVLNEGEHVHRLLESLVTQTRPPDEVVIVDGGSSDDTVANIERYADRLPLRVLVEPGCNISRGRNVAIAAAQGDIIAVTDFGVRLHETWLERLTQPLLDDPDCMVASGFFRAEMHTPFDLAMSATVLPLRDEISPETFLPSSRSVAFRKQAWQAVGGYPEWLDYSEDLVFDLRLKQRYGAFAFVPDALVDFRPRTSLRSFFRQYFLYARGDGKADLWRVRHAIRYLTYLVALPLIFILGWRVQPLLWLLYIVGGAVYLGQAYRRLPVLRQWGPPLSAASLLYVLALIPVIRVVGDIAKMIGYPVGLWWRWRVHPPDWRQ